MKVDIFMGTTSDFSCGTPLPKLNASDPGRQTLDSHCFYVIFSVYTIKAMGISMQHEVKNRREKTKTKQKNKKQKQKTKNKKKNNLKLVIVQVKSNYLSSIMR